ncbi:MAG TPA: hypothetical protein VF587_06105 [Solirubrobacteraceae bacterium]|jgi:hypothetical protein
MLAATLAASILFTSCMPGPACWRPYAQASPFNQPLPAQPALARGSERLIGGLVGDPLTVDRPDHVVAADDGSQGEPAVYSGRDDPDRRVHCTEPWGRCEIEGARVNIPDGVVPEAGTDRHLAVIETHTGLEFDFWGLHAIDERRVAIRWGGAERVWTGMGNTSAATASSFAGLAGRLRADELAAGEIRHALNVVVRCTNGHAIFPAENGHGGTACTKGTVALPMGARLQLQVSDAQLAAIDPSRRPVYRAMRDYGMFVGDTGSGGLFSIETEAGMRLPELAAAQGWARTIDDDGRYLPFDGDGIDWRAQLRVIHPCVSEGSC